MTSFQWSTEQAQTLESLTEFRKGPPGVFVLAGYAGTGKTTLCVEALRSSTGLVFTAPTHKAVGVLFERGGIPGAEYSTIHRLLGCRRVRKDGKTEFLPDFDRASWSNHDVIVIDEVSMIGETMWGWIMDAQAAWPRHVICMGDPAQLPPVDDGDGLSPAFDNVSAQLTDVQRSAGPVLAAASRVRAHLAAVDPVDVELAPGQVDRMKRRDFVELAVEDFQAGRDAKILAWTNKAVDFVNAMMRRRLFGEDVPDAPQPGERRVVVSTWGANDESIMLHAGRDIEVVSAKRAWIHDLPCWEIDALGIDVYLHQLRPEGLAEYRRRLSNLRHECRSGRKPWREYYRLEDAFISLRPGYATTVHKSQGSTYQTAYVVDRNLRQCPDPQVRNMLRYVAFSRASHRLVLS